MLVKVTIPQDMPFQIGENHVVLSKDIDYILSELWAQQIGVPYKKHKFKNLDLSLDIDLNNKKILLKQSPINQNRNACFLKY